MPIASPQQTPLASSQGRNSSPRTGPYDAGSAIWSGTSRAILARYQSRSATRHETAQRMKNARKMSSSASRDSTNCRPSRLSSSPATRPSAVEPVIRRASRHITSTISDPITAAAIRQPNGSIPNAFSPSAISHLPASGWTIIDGLSVH